jgi:hypothetical protein
MSVSEKYCYRITIVNTPGLCDISLAIFLFGNNPFAHAEKKEKGCDNRKRKN